MIDLSEEERRVLVHALTGSYPDGKVCRNFYAASTGHHWARELNRLVAEKLMRVGNKYGKDGNYYHCTAAGAAAVGLRLPEC
jgi:hypothetical protein